MQRRNRVVIEANLAFGIAPDAVDAHGQFTRLLAQPLRFDQKSRHKLAAIYAARKNLVTAPNESPAEKSSQWIFCEGKFLHDFSADQMFLDDAFQNFRRAGVIPDAFGINDSDWPLRADAEAVGLGAINQRFGTDEI